ncbi:C-type lectin domain family 10 member A-like [Odontesthes bonariensis]|uniref:C-type lectin domain family 10 member A-like n=1 Tax=Odontesthes bonariensis TaxID=219752 RepID=UPI003F580450
MDSQYHHFGSADSTTVSREYNNTTQTGMRRIVIYILYSVLVLLLLILLMVTGIKFSQMSKEISEVKLQIGTISRRGSTSMSNSGTCREGWVSFQRSCYLLSTNTVTWSKAEEQCKSQRGHLVVLNNGEELDYISRIVDISYDYWIGLVERQHEGQWSWVDGTDFSSTPTFWDAGQPDDWDFRENGEDCGQLHKAERRKRKRWNDADCSLLYRYICEAKA